MSDELVPKYEEWIAKLERNLVGLVQERKNMLRVFIVLVAISPAGAYWSIWLTITTAFLGACIYGTTLYITEMRRHQYTQELEKTRYELERMREPRDVPA